MHVLHELASRFDPIDASRAPSTQFGSLHPALAFTRYCYYQYCMVYGIPKGGRGGVVYCPIAVQSYCNRVGNAGGPEE